MRTASESTHRLNNKSYRTFRRTFVGEKKSRVGGNDADERQRW
jgi:ribosomal protein S20